MSKRSHGKKELSEIQQLKHENKALKRQVQQLRKLASRIDSDRLDMASDILREKEYEEEQFQVVTNNINDWKCYDCKVGTLKLTVLPRRDKVVYYRKCDCCPRRTKTKDYTDDVKE